MAQTKAKAKTRKKLLLKFLQLKIRLKPLAEVQGMLLKTTPLIMF
jgi:hypothetical protein